MSRLIDADALMEDIKKHCAMPSWCYAVIAAEMDEQPTVEAAPVVRGEWIGDTCSACNLNWDENMVGNADDWGYFDPMPNFCPNCGADMRKEKK